MKTSHLVIGSLLIGSLLGAAPSLAEFKLWRGRIRSAELFSGGMIVQGSGDVENGELMPRVVVDESDFDFGVMERFSLMKHDFVFTNEGEQPVQLKIGDTTCKCTLGKIAQDTLAPGESAKVTLEWEAKTPGDEFRQQAAIHLYGPQHDKIVLTIFGKVTDSLSILPRDLVFSSVPIDTAADGEIRIISYLEDDLDIVDHRLTNPENASFFDVSVEPVPNEEINDPHAKRMWRILVHLNPGLPVGALTQSLELDTTSEKIGTIDIPIRGKIASKIRILGKGYNPHRDTLKLGTILQSEGRKTKLTILVRGEHQPDANFRIAKTTPKSLIAQVTEVEPMNKGKATKVTLAIEIPKGSKGGVYLGGNQGRPGEILLESDHPEARAIRIPVHFSVIE